jgi:hypothetical protein
MNAHSFSFYAGDGRHVPHCTHFKCKRKEEFRVGAEKASSQLPQIEAETLMCRSARLSLHDKGLSLDGSRSYANRIASDTNEDTLAIHPIQCEPVSQHNCNA